MRKPNSALFWDYICFKMHYRQHHLGPTLSKYKREEFLKLFDKWIDLPLALIAKTDSFEEAFGSDSILDWFAKKGKRAIGLDISPEILNEARKQIDNEKLTWVATDISRMPFKDSIFDLVFSSATYGYLDNTVGGLKEAYRILKPKGVLIISVINRHNFSFLLVTSFCRLIKSIPFPLSRAFRLNKFKGLLQEAGFIVEEYEPIMCLHRFWGFFIPYLEKRNLKIFKIILEILIRNLKKYNTKNISSNYLRAWFIVFKAKKP